MKAVEISLGKEEFLEFLHAVTDARVRLLVFSTNSEQAIFASGGHKGRTKNENRVFLQGKSTLLDRVAETYRNSVKPLGGKFQVSFRGARAMETKRYFIEWVKTRGLLQFEHSNFQNQKPKTPIEILALMARPSL